MMTALYFYANGVPGTFACGGRIGVWKYVCKEGGNMGVRQYMEVSSTADTTTMLNDKLSTAGKTIISNRAKKFIMLICYVLIITFTFYSSKR